MSRSNRVIESPFCTLADGRRVLQCHSRGDRRFSPFCCYVEAFGRRDSIENHYQRAKVFESNRVPRDWKEAKTWKKNHLKQIAWQIGPFRLPCTQNQDKSSFDLSDFGIQFYIGLWHKYLLANTRLITLASQFDEFEDPFKGSFPFCQADVIRQSVQQGVDSLRPMYSQLRSLLINSNATMRA